MKGTMEFRYDQVNDVVIATARWKIETAEDVQEWYRQYVEHMKRYGRRMDTIILCDDLEVKPSIGALWGEHRAKINQQYIRFSYRVHTKRNVMVFVHTSGARFNASTQEAPSVEDALAAIRVARAEARAG